MIFASKGQKNISKGLKVYFIKYKNVRTVTLYNSKLLPVVTDPFWFRFNLIMTKEKTFHPRTISLQFSSNIPYLLYCMYCCRLHYGPCVTVIFNLDGDLQRRNQTVEDFRSSNVKRISRLYNTFLVHDFTNVRTFYLWCGHVCNMISYFLTSRSK